jgi:hypothetical protein
MNKEFFEKVGSLIIFIISSLILFTISLLSNGIAFLCDCAWNEWGGKIAIFFAVLFFLAHIFFRRFLNKRNDPKIFLHYAVFAIVTIALYIAIMWMAWNYLGSIEYTLPIPTPPSLPVLF